MPTDSAIFGNWIRIRLLKAVLNTCFSLKQVLKELRKNTTMALSADANAFGGRKGSMPVEVCEFEGHIETRARRRPESCARRSPAILGRVGANPRHGTCAAQHSDCRPCSARRARRHRRGCKAIGREHILLVPKPQAIPFLQTRGPKTTLFGTRNRTAHQTISIRERSKYEAW